MLDMLFCVVRKTLATEQLTEPTEKLGERRSRRRTTATVPWKRSRSYCANTKIGFPFCAEAMIKDPYKNLDVYTSCFNRDTGVVKLMSVLSAHSKWIKSRICKLPWSHCI